MGNKFKEVNTLSFIGNIGPKTERVWKEVDEEIDIIGCKDKFDRPCQLIAPLNLLKKDLAGDSDTKQVPIFVNDDVRIELMHCRSSKGKDGRQPAGFCETQIQVENQRMTRTSEGDFELDEGDVLIVPASISHENSGAGSTTRLIVYTRAPVQIAQTYPVKRSVIPNKHVAETKDCPRPSGRRRLRWQAFRACRKRGYHDRNHAPLGCAKNLSPGIGSGRDRLSTVWPARNAYQSGRIHAGDRRFSVDPAGNLAPQHRQYGDDPDHPLHQKAGALGRRICRARQARRAAGLVTRLIFECTDLVSKQ
jgi:hypothetical protein